MLYEDIKNNKEIKEFIRKGNQNLAVMGYTDHSEEHCILVAQRAGKILDKFGYSNREVELAKVAGFMHDIGNVINRNRHGEYGAILAGEILKKQNVTLEERIIIMSAIGNHDESTGGANDPVSAALIIGDKTDVRRSRVKKTKGRFDIHDRVNYAVTDSKLKISVDKKVISLNLQIDEKICTMYEYFDIFLGRMMMCRGAAELLGGKFKLTANGCKVL